MVKRILPIIALFSLSNPVGVAETRFRLHQQGVGVAQTSVANAKRARSTRQAALRKLNPGTTVFIDEKTGIKLVNPGDDFEDFWSHHPEMEPYRAIATATNGIVTVGDIKAIHPLFSMVLDHAKPSSQGTPELDVVVVVDTTTSMGPMIRAVGESLEKLGQKTDVFSSEGSRIRLSLVAFRDYDVNPVAEVMQRFTYSTESFAKKVKALQLEGGGSDFPEPIYEGAAVAFQKLAWRPHAERRMIWITDAAPKVEGGPTAEAIINLAKTSARPTVIYPMYVGGRR